MTRAAQNMLLLLVGAAVLWLTIATGEYVNYVKPGLRIPLIVSALILIALGVSGIRKDWHGDDPHVPAQAPAPRAEALVPSHQHARGRVRSRLAALLLRSRRGAGPQEYKRGGRDLRSPGGRDTHLLGDRDFRDLRSSRSQGFRNLRSPGDRDFSVPGKRNSGTPGSAYAHDAADGHDHGHHGPRVAWLLCLPVLAVFAIAPPELGAFTATRADATRQIAPPESAGYALPEGTDPVKMSVAEFAGRSYEAQLGGESTLLNRKVRLVGFATPRKEGGWYLTRLQMSCCAADSIAVRIAVHGAPSPAKGTWVEVTGTWSPPAAPAEGANVHEIQAAAVTTVRKPANPYE